MTFSGSPNPDPGDIRKNEDMLNRERAELLEQERIAEERRILEEEVPYWRRQEQIESGDFIEDPEGPHYSSIAAETGIGITTDFATGWMLGTPFAPLYYPLNFGVGYSANALAQWMRGDWDDFSHGEALAAGGFQTIPFGTTAKGLKGLTRATTKGAVGSVAMAQLEVGIDERRRLTGQELFLSSILGGTVAGGFKSAELVGDLKVPTNKRYSMSMSEGDYNYLPNLSDDALIDINTDLKNWMIEESNRDIVNELNRVATIKHKSKVRAMMSVLNMPDGVFRMAEYNKAKGPLKEVVRRNFIELFQTPQDWLKIPKSKGTFSGFKDAQGPEFHQVWNEFVRQKGMDPIRDVQLHHLNALFDSLHLYEGVKWYSDEWWDLTATLLRNNVRPGVTFDHIKNKGNLIFTIGKQTDPTTPHGVAHLLYDNKILEFYNVKSRKDIENSKVLKRMGRDSSFRNEKAVEWSQIVKNSEDVLLEAHKVYKSLNLNIDMPLWELFQIFDDYTEFGYSKLIDPKYQVPDIPNMIKTILKEVNKPDYMLPKTVLSKETKYQYKSSEQKRSELSVRWEYKVYAEIKDLENQINNPKLFKMSRGERNLLREDVAALKEQLRQYYQAEEYNQGDLIRSFPNIWRNR